MLLNVTQAAELLGYSRHSVWAMMQRGELAFIPRGTKHKRIARSEIERWIKDNSVRGFEQARILVNSKRRKK